MMFSFIAIPAVLSSSYYSWSELDSNTYPRPDFYDTPSTNSQLGMWQTTMIVISYFTLPQYVQRIYATESIKNLKFSFSILTVSTWFTILVSVYIGTIGVQILNNEEVSSPFTSIVATLLDLGGFARALGYIALTASLAAIMSTTGKSASVLISNVNSCVQYEELMFLARALHSALCIFVWLSLQAIFTNRSYYHPSLSP